MLGSLLCLISIAWLLPAVALVRILSVSTKKLVTLRSSCAETVDTMMNMVADVRITFNEFILVDSLVATAAKL